MTVIVQSLRPDPTRATGYRVEWVVAIDHHHAPTAWRLAWREVDGCCADRASCRRVRVTERTWALQLL